MLALRVSFLIVLFVGCRSEVGIEGAWRYDPERFDELAVVQRADATPRGTLGGAFADDSERAEALRILRREAEATTWRVTKDSIVVDSAGEKQALSYSVSKHSGDAWELSVTENGKSNVVHMVLRGNQLTVKDHSGAVTYVLRR